MKENERLRYSCLVGMNADMMVHCIGRVDYPALGEFMAKITDLTKSAKEVRITTTAGMDVSFLNADPGHGGYSLGYADTPGSHMMAG